MTTEPERPLIKILSFVTMWRDFEGIMLSDMKGWRGIEVEEFGEVGNRQRFLVIS